MTISKLTSLESNKRVLYIDVMKGIGILMVALGHCIPNVDHPIYRAILSFHMPLFFFISGFLFCGKDWTNRILFDSYFVII